MTENSQISPEYEAAFIAWTLSNMSGLHARRKENKVRLVSFYEVRTGCWVVSLRSATGSNITNTWHSTSDDPDDLYNCAAWLYKNKYISKDAYETYKTAIDSMGIDSTVSDIVKIVFNVNTIRDNLGVELDILLRKEKVSIINAKGNEVDNLCTDTVAELVSATSTIRTLSRKAQQGIRAAYASVLLVGMLSKYTYTPRVSYIPGSGAWELALTDQKTGLTATWTSDAFERGEYILEVIPFMRSRNLITSEQEGILISEFSQGDILDYEIIMTMIAMTTTNSSHDFTVTWDKARSLHGARGVWSILDLSGKVLISGAIRTIMRYLINNGFIDYTGSMTCE